MRISYGFTAAAVGAALCALAPAAVAIDGTPVALDSTVQRTEGRCSYSATFRGHYRALPADASGTVHVRDAVVDVDAHVQCRGEAPVRTMQQLYYAGATERELLDRVAEVARLDHRAHHTDCAFVPEVHRTNGRLETGDVNVECRPVTHEHSVPPVATR